MEPYYYSKMNKLQKHIYQAIKTGLLNHQPSFPVPRVEGEQLQEIFQKVRLDCPEIFFATGYKYRFYPDSTNIQMIPEYLFDKKKVREHSQAMQARVVKLARQAETLSEVEKELYIHDFICNNVYYDKLKKPYSHEIIGPLGHGVSVCEGIAKAVKCLCDALGVWCIIVISEANPAKQVKYRHAWNVVRISGRYYHLDATFDNTLSKEGVIRYDYFNLNDQQIFRDHEPVIYEIPVCSDGAHSYYREKKLSFTKLEDVGKRALQAIRKGKPLIFHWRGGYLTGEAVSELVVVLERAARDKGRHGKISLNQSQAVMQVIFSERVPDQELVLETANEGEAELA